MKLVLLVVVLLVLILLFAACSLLVLKVYFCAAVEHYVVFRPLGICSSVLESV